MKLIKSIETNDKFLQLYENNTEYIIKLKFLQVNHKIKLNRDIKTAMVIFDNYKDNIFNFKENMQ